MVTQLQKRIWRRMAWFLALIYVVSLSACGAKLTPSVVNPRGTPNPAFVLSSPAVAEGGDLPKEYTCDGASATLPLEWQGAPPETQSFAVVMHHIPGPGDSHWYWIIYDIPADIHSLAKNGTGVGLLGSNSVNERTVYAPPCSKGPGQKIYTYTLYALAEPPQFAVAPAQISRNLLLTAIQDRTLASAELNVIYAR